MTKKLAQALINRMTSGHKAHTLLSKMLRRIPLSVWDRLGQYAWSEK